MVLIAITLMVLAPATAVVPSAGYSTLSIQTLDVCHASASGINLDLPDSIHERPCTLSPLLFAGVQDAATLPFKVSLITFQDERPPQA